MEVCRLTVNQSTEIYIDKIVLTRRSVGGATRAPIENSQGNKGWSGGATLTMSVKDALSLCIWQLTNSVGLGYSFRNGKKAAIVHDHLMASETNLVSVPSSPGVGRC